VSKHARGTDPVSAPTQRGVPRVLIAGKGVLPTAQLDPLSSEPPHV
jgi:hypothetical protein